MTVLICTIYIIVVILPILSTSVVWRINVNAVNFFCIEVFKKLKSMIIISFYQRMPQIGIWCIAD